MSKSPIKPEVAASAVHGLVSKICLTDYFKELAIMHGAFIRSDWADDQRIRSQVTSTHDALRDFILELKENGKSL